MQNYKKCNKNSMHKSKMHKINSALCWNCSSRFRDRSRRVFSLLQNAAEDALKTQSSNITARIKVATNFTARNPHFNAIYERNTKVQELIHRSGTTTYTPNRISRSKSLKTPRRVLLLYQAQFRQIVNSAKMNEGP